MHNCTELWGHIKNVEKQKQGIPSIVLAYRIDATCASQIFIITLIFSFILNLQIYSAVEIVVKPPSPKHYNRYKNVFRKNVRDQL